MAKFRFDFLLQLALDEREEAAKKLQAAQSEWLAAQAKMAQIDGYRSEYRNRLASSGQGGITIAQWRDFQLFLTKLDAAAEQQASQLAGYEKRYQQMLKAWQECEKKVKGFEVLKDRHQQQELHKEGAREQKMLDEFNSRRRQ